MNKSQKPLYPFKLPPAKFERPIDPQPWEHLGLSLFVSAVLVGGSAVSLWYYLIFLWWLMTVGTFSCSYWSFVYLLWNVFSFLPAFSLLDSVFSVLFCCIVFLVCIFQENYLVRSKFSDIFCQFHLADLFFTFKDSFEMYNKLHIFKVQNLIKADIGTPWKLRAQLRHLIVSINPSPKRFPDAPLWFLLLHPSTDLLSVTGDEFAMSTFLYAFIISVILFVFD